MDEDSNTSDGAASPQLAPQTTTTLTTQNLQMIHLPSGLTLDFEQAQHCSLTSSGNNIPSPPDIGPLLQKISTGQKLVISPSVSAITSQSFNSASVPAVASSSSSSKTSSSSSQSSNSSKLNRTKKPKPKCSPKTKVIKFHEYKGPPSANKNNSSNTTTTTTTTSTAVTQQINDTYRQILQQNDLILKWQMENMRENSLSAATTPTEPPTAPTPQPSPSPAPSKSSSSNNTKATKIEDLKVNELKAECKKRSLIVSGPKQALLDRLKPYADQIIEDYNQQNQPQPSALINNDLQINSSSLSSVKSLKSVSGLINIQPLTPGSVSASDENSVTMNSPPQSPENASDLALSHGGSVTSGPLSPDMNMDIASPPPSGFVCLAQQAVTKKQLSLSQSGLSMMVDQLSRPSSVGPMDIDSNSLVNGLTSLTSPIQSPVLEQASLVPPPPPPPPPPLPKSTASPVVLPAGSPQQIMQPPISSTQFINVQLPTQVQVGQQQIVWQEDIVRQQQRQIEELQRQLLESREKVKELEQQKEPKTPLKVSLAPMSTNLVSATQSITIPADTKVVISPGPIVNNTVAKQNGPVKIAPATSKAKKLQTITISTSAPSLSSIVDSKVCEMKDIKPKQESRSRSDSKTKADLKSKADSKAKMDNKPNYLLQPQAIQQSLMKAQILNNATRSSSSFLVTSTCVNSSKTTIVTIPATAVTSGKAKARNATLTINGLNNNM